MSKVKPVVIQRNSLKTLNCIGNNIFQEDVIYRATPNDFLKGKYPNLVISNKINKLSNSSKTRASFSNSNSSIVELNSDAVTQLLGQKNYDLVFAALCSVINQDLKIKALLSLLTTKKTDNNGSKILKYNVATQTEQSHMAQLIKEKQRRKHRRVAKPYVVTDKLTKVVIHPKQKSQVEQENCEPDLPNLKLMDEELSNASWGSTGNLSILSDNIPNTVLDPNFMLNNIDKHTEDILENHDTSVEARNRSDSVAIEEQTSSAHSCDAKVEENFHLPSNDLLVDMSLEDKQILLQQALIDFKFCIQRDDDDNLPIHQAVLEDNASMLKRQCIMLSKRGESIDELSGNHFTALQLSIFHDSLKCMEVLLQFKADVFVTDDDGRTSFHLAAEKETDHLKLLLDHCKKDFNIVLRQNEDLWREFCERQSNEGTVEFLLRSISVLCDSQGYTPLMLASKSGIAKNVKLLVDIAPDTINMLMPNCGNTALYLAVAAACLDAEDHDDKSKVSQNYLKTVETLIVNGGDPYLQNSSGGNVNDLLCDSNTGNPKSGYLITLSLLIANKLTSVKYFKGNNVKNFEKYMLIRNSQGDISIADLHKKKVKGTRASKKGKTRSVTSDDDTNEAVPTNMESSLQESSSNVNADKPIILYNIPIVNVTQSATVPSKTCINEKNKTATTRPIILRQNKRNRTKSQKNIITNIGNRKFLKILPKLEPDNKVISTTKRLNSDVKITTSKKLKTNSVNT